VLPVLCRQGAFGPPPPLRRVIGLLFGLLCRSSLPLVPHTYHDFFLTIFPCHYLNIDYFAALLHPRFSVLFLSIYLLAYRDCAVPFRTRSFLALKARISFAFDYRPDPTLAFNFAQQGPPKAS
jgi:hypothetical protein